MKNREIIILTVVMVALVILRVMSPWENFNPLGAVALMGGLLFTRKILAVSITFGALLLGDLLLSLKDTTYSEYLFSSSFLFVYAAFAVILVLGISLAKKPSVANVLGGSVLAAVAFFLVSNFGSWLYLEMYPKTLEGLTSCMAAGLPFFRGTITSQIIFSLGIYTVYNLATSRKVVLA